MKRVPVARRMALARAAATGLYGALAHRFGAEGAQGVRGLGEENLGAGDVGKGRDVVVAERRGGDLSGAVDVDMLIERAADGLGDAALDLTSALQRVHDRAGVGGMDAAENADFARRAGERRRGRPAR